MNHRLGELSRGAPCEFDSFGQATIVAADPGSHLQPPGIPDLHPLPPATEPATIAAGELCACFVAEPGLLALNAALLAASLREVYGSELEILVGTPGGAGAGLSADERALFDALGVRLLPIENPIGPHYRIGNKLGCLAASLDIASRRYLAFIDSDVICLRAIERPPASWAFAAKPADSAALARDTDQWQKLYSRCGEALPRERVAATVTGEWMPPYYNAGFLLLDPKAACGLGREWIAVAGQCVELKQQDSSIVFGNDAVPGRSYNHLDQFSLPIAIARLGLRTSVLDERWNLPLPKRNAIPSDTSLVHYHRAQDFFSVPALREFWFYAVRKYPALLSAARGLGPHAKHGEANEWLATGHAAARPAPSSDVTDAGDPGFARDDGKGLAPNSSSALERLAPFRGTLRQPEWRDGGKLVLIVGLQKSGTTLLMRALRDLPGFVDFARGEGDAFWGTMPPHEPSDPPFGTVYARTQGRQGHQVLPGDLDFELFATARTALEHARLSAGGHEPVLFNKNPYNTVRIPALRALYPRATIVCMFRDPVATVFSLLKKHHVQDGTYADGWWGVKPADWESIQGAAPIQRIAAQWASAYRFVLAHRSSVDLLLSYSDLTAGPTSCIRRIAVLAGADARDVPVLPAFADYDGEFRTGADIVSRNNPNRVSGRELPPLAAGEVDVIERLCRPIHDVLKRQARPSRSGRVHLTNVLRGLLGQGRVGISRFTASRPGE